MKFHVQATTLPETHLGGTHELYQSDCATMKNMQFLGLK